MQERVNVGHRGDGKLLVIDAVHVPTDKDDSVKEYLRMRDDHKLAEEDQAANQCLLHPPRVFLPWHKMDDQASAVAAEACTQRPHANQNGTGAGCSGAVCLAWDLLLSQIIVFTVSRAARMTLSMSKYLYMPRRPPKITFFFSSASALYFSYSAAFFSLLTG